MEVLNRIPIGIPMALDLEWSPSSTAQALHMYHARLLVLRLPWENSSMFWGPEMGWSCVWGLPVEDAYFLSFMEAKRLPHPSQWSLVSLGSSSLLFLPSKFSLSLHFSLFISLSLFPSLTPPLSPLSPPLSWNDFIEKYVNFTDPFCLSLASPHQLHSSYLTIFIHLLCKSIDYLK